MFLSYLVRFLIDCICPNKLIEILMSLQFQRLEDARNALSLNGQLEIAGRVIKVIAIYYNVALLQKWLNLYIIDFFCFVRAYVLKSNLSVLQFRLGIGCD